MNDDLCSSSSWKRRELEKTVGSSTAMPGQAIIWSKCNAETIPVSAHPDLKIKLTHWCNLLEANTTAMLSNAIICEKLLFHIGWRSTSAAAENYCRPFKLQDGRLLPRRLHFSNCMLRCKIFTFFETTGFYIFCTLTGDNDQHRIFRHCYYQSLSLVFRYWSYSSY